MNFSTLIYWVLLGFQHIFKEILVSMILVFRHFPKKYSFVSYSFFKKYSFGFTRLKKKYSFWLLVFLTSNWQNYSFFQKRVKNGLTSKKKTYACSSIAVYITYKPPMVLTWGFRVPCGIKFMGSIFF